MKTSKGLVAGFWISTMLFALQMGFTAYAQLRLPRVAAAFAHLGFPDYFRIELSWAKFAGLAVLLLPMAPARLKEWAYAGFAITLLSAIIADVAVGEGVKAWGWAQAPACCGRFRTSSSAGYKAVPSRSIQEKERMPVESCIPVIPSEDLEKSLRFGSRALDSP
jgi:hypothetical protein